MLAAFKQNVPVVTSLVKAGETIVIGANEQPPQGCLKGFVSEEIAIYVKVVGLIDIKLETNRIEKRVKELETLKTNLNKKMTIPNYETKVPQNVRDENTEKMRGYDNEISEQFKQLDIMKQLM